jgi:hypothetical protein
MEGLKGVPPQAVQPQQQEKDRELPIPGKPMRVGGAESGRAAFGSTTGNAAIEKRTYPELPAADGYRPKSGIGRPGWCPQERTFSAAQF